MLLYVCVTDPDQPTDVDPDYKADTDTVEVTWYSPRIYKGRILKYRVRLYFLNKCHSIYGNVLL